MSGPPASRRHIPNAINREVYERDDGRCTYTGTEDHRCAEQFRLEFHHLKAWGKGGGHSAQNIALVCPTHNRLAADNDFGREYMSARIRARQLTVTSGSTPSNRQSRNPACHHPNNPNRLGSGAPLRTGQALDHSAVFGGVEGAIAQAVDAKVLGVAEYHALCRRDDHVERGASLDLAQA